MPEIAGFSHAVRLFQLDGLEQNRNISDISESLIGQSGTIAQSTSYPQVNRKQILNQVDLENAGNGPMLALVCTLAFAASATFALGAIFVTMQGRRGQIASLLAEYRSLERDREFLVHVTSHEVAAPRAFAAPQLRRTPRRAFKQAEAHRASRSLRAAA